MADRTELEDQVAKLTALVEEMQTRIVRMEGPARHVAVEEPRSRRDLLKLGGAAALGAVGAAAMRAVPAAATNGDPLLAGQSFTASAPTTLVATITPLEVFGAEAKGYAGGIKPPANTFFAPLQGLGDLSADTLLLGPFADGVDGWASGTTAIGVYGLTDTGAGVVGESGTGVSVYARASGRIQQDPHNLDVLTGLPDYSPGDMEQVRDAAGTLWLSNAAGNWRRASTFEVFPNARRVYGKGVVLPKGAIVTNIDATMTNGTVPAPTGVPVGAQAAWCAIETYEPTVISVYPTGTPDTHFAAYAQMGTAGLSVQLSWTMVPLNAAGRFSFTNIKAPARVYFDVWGYLTQS